ncbi:MAG: methyl-accepting chemotaxis protein [Phycisphaerales bacterium]
MNKPPFLKSIAGRLLLLGVVPAMLAIAAVIVLGTLDSYEQLLSAEQETLRAQADGAAREMDIRNDRWNSVVQVMAAAQTNGLFGQRAQSSGFVREVAEMFTLRQALPQIIGAYVLYEPDADGNDAKAAKSTDAPRDAMDANGRFLAHWHFDDAKALRSRPATGMESMDYYLGPKADFGRTGKPGPYMTEPWVSEGVARISHLHPIVVGGRFAGVVGVDRALLTIEATLADIKERFGVDVFLLSRAESFIAATTDHAASGAERHATSLKDRRLAETPFAPLGAIWHGAGDRVVVADDPQLGEPCFFAVAEMPVGGWTLVIRETKAEVMAPANRSLRRNILLGLLGMVVVGGLMFLASRTFARRVQVAVETADLIARGDLTRDVERSTSADETGLLLGAMGTMSGNLNGLAGSVRRASIQLNSTATEMTATAKQQEAAASRFGAASSEIAAAVKEISATSQDLVRTMDGVNTAAGETAALATSGRAGLQGMEAVMGDLVRATASIAEKLAAINERSQKITTVVTTITRVADQTNILSINAAIEAEKAGEYGGGFLVIAREIRRLADQTAAATLDIEQMVKQMQSAVGAGVMEMDRFGDQVRRGEHDVATIGSQLGEIIERVNASTDSFRQVSESMQSQSEGAQQISDAMVQLSGTASQTMQSIHEFGRAAEDLQSAIGSLREAVSQFKVKD